MARISGVDIPKQKRGVIALTYIFGIGKSMASKILSKAKVNEDKKVSECSKSGMQREKSNVSLSREVSKADMPKLKSF